MERTDMKNNRSTLDKKSISQLEEELKKIDAKKAAYRDAIKRKKERERKQHEKAIKFHRQRDAIAFLTWAESTKMPILKKASGSVYDYYQFVTSKNCSQKPSDLPEDNSTKSTRIGMDNEDRQSELEDRGSSMAMSISSSERKSEQVLDDENDTGSKMLSIKEIMQST